MTKLIRFKDELENISNNKSKVAVLIHGMLSSKLQMNKLKTALLLRKCYDKILVFDMPLTHNIIPYYYTKTDADYAASYITKKIRKNKLIGPIDIIGHSNGGYVALNLMNRLDNVNYIYTVGTPSANVLNFKFDLIKSNKKSIIHFVGDKDFFRDKLGMETPLSKSRYIVHFPDEGHCSIHSDSDVNGLADIIAYLNGKESSHCFIDNKNTLHIWPFCKGEVSPNNKRYEIDLSKPIIVCNGIHDTDDKIPVAIDAFRKSSGWIEYIINYFYMIDIYNEKIDGLIRAKNALRPIKSKLQLEIDNIDEDILKIKKLNKILEEKIIHNTNNFIEEYKYKIKKYQKPLELALLISSMKRLNIEQIKVINQLLKISNNNLEKFVTYHQSKLKSNNPKRIL